MATTQAERRARQEGRLATLVMAFVERSGVSLSPSTVRYQLAIAFAQELSQRNVDRLVRRLEELVLPEDRRR